MELEYFGRDRWQAVTQTYRAYWDKSLQRPVLPYVIAGARTPKRKCPKAPLLCFETSADTSFSMKEFIDRYDYELSTYEYLGDSFPIVLTDAFGPGLASAFLGAEVEAKKHTVWFHVDKPKDIRELHFIYDGGNFWLDRIREFFYEGTRLWQGEVVLAMPDLGGMLDILAVFRTTEGLLTDLYDYSDEVKRCTREIMDCWYKYYDELSAIMGRAPVRGYSDWSTLLYFAPGYIMQSDFSYMISPDMFKQFVLWELAEGTRRLGKTVYHLDGVGELPHLPMLLELPELDAVQWVPGAGAPADRNWADVYGAIENSGKLLHSYDYGTGHIAAALKRPGALTKRQQILDISMRGHALEELKKFGAL